MEREIIVNTKGFMLSYHLNAYHVETTDTFGNTKLTYHPEICVIKIDKDPSPLISGDKLLKYATGENLNDIKDLINLGVDLAKSTWRTQQVQKEIKKRYANINCPCNCNNCQYK